jgi:hypothetical protein
VKPRRETGDADGDAEEHGEEGDKAGNVRNPFGPDNDIWITPGSLRSVDTHAVPGLGGSQGFLEFRDIVSDPDNREIEQQQSPEPDS